MTSVAACFSSSDRTWLRSASHRRHHDATESFIQRLLLAASQRHCKRTLLHGMRCRKQKYGMVTMCIGTGMGAAEISEAL